MPERDFTEQISKIRRHREVSSLEPLVHRQARPAPVDPPATHATPENEHRGAVAMIGAAPAVFRHRTAELRHRHDDRVFEPIAQIVHKRGQTAGEVVEPLGKLTLRPTFVDMMVSAAGFGERDLDTNLRLDELRKLLQRDPEG